MEPSRESHVMLRLVYFWRWGNKRLEVGILNQSQASLTTFMFGCYATQTVNPGTKSNLETTIEPRDLVYYLGLEPGRHRREAKV